MTHDLTGPWRLSDAAGEFTCDMTLPGDTITALHAAGLIPDPYWGRNEYDLRPLADRDWILRRTVTLDDAEVDLVIDGLDTVATVRVNGHDVLHADNAFRTWRADLSDAAQVGETEIEIVLHSSTAASAGIAARQPFPIPQSFNCPIPHGNLLRKPACDTGWDWNIALAPAGVLGDIRLVPRDETAIERVAIAQDHSGDTITLTVTIHAPGADGSDCMALFDGVVEEGTIHDGTARLVFALPRTEYDLWWPAGLGTQTLYDLTVKVGLSDTYRRIGLRDVKLVTAPDAAGSSFAFHVNGHPTFMRGANWIPADALAGRITRDATRELLQSAIDANMNMIRIWGGGRYEATWFYDLCDEMGLMVWQDFMFACNIYPSDRDYLANVAAEVRDNVARMHHHACIALWCGDNELIGALGWYPETRADRDRYLVNYDRLNRCVEDALRDTDPTAIWWPSSPSPGRMNFGDAWHDDGNGDMHFWSVWHEGRDFDHYRDVSPRFCSEFGFQSYPSMEVIHRFAEPADFNIASPVLESHQKNEGGNARIAETMFRYFRWPERFADFVWLSQVQQGMAIETAVTHWRSLRPHCMGTLIWQLNDTWPVCSWSSLDHGGGWKLLHHMAQHFFAPVTVTAVPVGDTIELRGINDTRAAVDIEVTCHATAMDGTARAIGTGRATVGGDATLLCTIDAADIGAQEVLSYRWTSSGGGANSGLHAPHPWKHYALPEPRLAHEITADGGTHTLSITTSAMAFYVTAEADVPGRWSDAAVHLAPGETLVLRFTPDDTDAIPTFTLRDLWSATTKQRDTP